MSFTKTGREMVGARVSSTLTGSADQPGWTVIVSGFWLLVVVLLGARVALFEDITAARVFATQFALLSVSIDR